MRDNSQGPARSRSRLSPLLHKLPITIAKSELKHDQAMKTAIFIASEGSALSKETECMYYVISMFKCKIRVKK